jgi:phosphoglycerol transferase MdoB-like AlkP superfamily enzyme
MELEIKPASPYESLYLPIRTVIFYLFFLFLWRWVFVSHNDIEHLWEAERHGLKLDLSMVCGIVVLQWLPWLAYLLTGWDIFRKVLVTMAVVLWTSICLIEFSSVVMYKDWGATLDARAISYLTHLREAWASSRSSIAFWPCIFLLFLYVSGMKRLLLHYDNWQKISGFRFQSWVFAIVVGPIAFIGLRGGLGKWPLTPSDAFYSESNNKNFAAVNKTWYFLYSLAKDGTLTLTSSDAEISKNYTAYISYRHSLQPLDTSIINFQGKNIVLIITEGWAGSLTKYLGGTENITPSFDSLANRSILYHQMYSTGFRTDQGLPSLLSGVPSVGGFNMLNQMEKAAKFPSLVTTLEAQGYQSSFVYGGDLNFANMANYLQRQGFDTIIDEKSFEDQKATTEWGIPDHISVEKSIQTIDKHDKKFFSTLLLLSSHVPFEIPVSNDIKGGDTSSKYKASVKYSDYALGRFFAQASTKPWHKNTIYIITSDHGSNHTGIENNVDERYHIPFIIHSPSMDSLKSNYRTHNSFDLPYTIAQSCGLQSDVFSFGVNMMGNKQVNVGFGVWSNDNDCQLVGVKEKKKEALQFMDVVKQWYNKL